MVASQPKPFPVNKHQQKTEATRRRLLKAALRVFVRDGFEAARIEDIAAEAGYTRGAFYAQFQTKEDLFFSLLEDGSQKHMDQVRTLLEGAGNDSERLHVLRDYYATRKADRQWAILLLEFKLYAVRHPRIRARLARMHRGIRNRMRWSNLDQLWPGRFYKDQACGDLARITLQPVLHALVLEHAYDPGSISEEQLGSLLRQIFDLFLA